MAQRIYIASDQLLVSHLYTLLEKAGISALTQKTALDVSMEDAGAPAWYSELWILQDCQLQRAHHILQQILLEETVEEKSPEILAGLVILPQEKSVGFPFKVSLFPPPLPPAAEIA